jgi:DNA-binding transcriptional MerR regulator
MLLYNGVMKHDDTFSIDQLSSLTETPRRTVRYYIQQGLVDRPEGSKRGSFYTTRHLEQLLEIRKWQRAGLSLERIRDLLVVPDDGELLVPPLRRRPGDVAVRSHVLIRPGVELVIDPDEAEMTPEQVRALVRKASDLLKGEEEKSK